MYCAYEVKKNKKSF